MKCASKWIGMSVLLAILVLGQSCKKASNPSAPAAPTPTFTLVPPCVNASNTPCTSTYTVTSTSTPTPSSTITSTWTGTSTSTRTSTSTPTLTKTATPTFTSTATNTATISPTITPTFTITSTATVTSTPTIYTFTTEGFESGTTVPANWSYTLFNSGYSSPLDVNTTNSYAGTNSLHMAVTYVGAEGGAMIAYNFNPPAPTNLSNKTVSFYYYIDQLPTASGSHYDLWIDSINGSRPITMVTPVAGIWNHVTETVNYGAANPYAVDRVSFYLYAGSTGPFNVVNIYLDEFSIQ